MVSLTSCAVEILEQVSAQLKKEAINPGSYASAQSLSNARQLDALVNAAKTRVKVLSQEEEDEATQGGEIPDIMDLANLFEWAGVHFVVFLIVSLKYSLTTYRSPLARKRHTYYLSPSAA